MHQIHNTGQTPIFCQFCMSIKR